MAGYRRRRSFHIGSCFAGGAITALLLIALGFDRRLPARMLAAEERAEKALGLHLHNPMAMRDRSGDAEQRQGGGGAQAASQQAATAAAAAGRAERPVDLQTQSSEQLADLMMWWRHSKPVKRPAGEPLYPPPNQTSYLTWEPDFAGLNNVRLQAELLVMMAHMMGRTLVLPDHLCTSIDHLSGPVSVGDFHDHGAMASWVPVLSMAKYLDARGVPADDPARTDGAALRSYLVDPARHTNTFMPTWDAVQNVLAPGAERQQPVPNVHPPFAEWIVMNADPSRTRQLVEYGEAERAAMTVHFRSDNDVRLFGTPGFIYYPTIEWQDFYWAGVRDYLHFQPDLIRMAAKVVRRVLDTAGGRYNALHYRSTDWAQQYPGLFITPETLTPKAVKVLGTHLPIYLAVDHANRTYLEPLIKAFPKVIFLDELLEEVLPGLDPNFHGILEQLVCSLGRRFMGTFGSTFSNYITRMRGYHSRALVADKGVYFTNFPEDDAAYGDTLRNNPWWAGSVWWPKQGAERFQHELWMREFQMTWDFRSETA